MFKIKLKKLTPSQILLRSFMIIIFIGALLLMLPIAHVQNESISLLTAVFTATSAVSVTGLSLVDVGNTFTIFGQIVILILIQLGGLGILTFSSLVMMLIGRKITYHEKRMLQEDLNHEKIGGIIRFTKRMIIIVLTIETMGALFLYIPFSKMFGHGLKAVYYAVFHSISAFCNAGFSLFSNSFEGMTGNYILKMTIAVLIIIGGIGFAVINTYLGFFKTGRKKISLTSRLAVRITIWLLLLGTVLILFTEYKNPDTLGQLPFLEKIMAAFFQSVTARTAGFNTINMESLRPATIFLFVFLMFVGASPASTGGGIKTTTFGVIFYSVISIIRNKKDIEIGNRRISWHILNRALAILVISLIYIFSVTLIILVIEERDLVKTFFEVVSAFGTVGLSMGLTASFTTASKILIIITMLIGRVGPLTFALALGENLKIPEYRYPRENISVG